MAVNYSVPLRNARANAILALVGPSPKLRMYTGTKPTAASDPSSGTLLAEMTLPAVWLAAASNGVVVQAGVWTTAAALASGSAGYVRIFDSSGTTCHIQANVPDEFTGVPSNNTLEGAPVTITGGIFTEGNA